MTSLRSRQKQDRRRRIMDAARRQFREKGFAGTTIESIAEEAGVSSVTVHNYYGTKGGVLLALVIESDARLTEKLERSLPRDEDDPVELTLRFASEIMDHATQNLEKDVWRQVLAAVIGDSGSQLSKAYFRLDRKLALVLARRLEAARARGALAAGVDPTALGQALFQLQNARFLEFIASDDVSKAEMVERLRADLTALGAMSHSPSHT